MSIPSDIRAEMENLQAQVQQYSPLANAPHSGIIAMQLNAVQLVEDVEASLVSSTLLDTFTSSSDTPSTVRGLLAVVQAAEDQADTSLLRGLVGRVASNLDQF